MMKLIGVAFQILALIGCDEAVATAEGDSPAVDSPGVQLRRTALTTSASELGFSSDADFPKVYGVLTDWDIGGVTASIMSLRDGTASLYTTSSFGVIGGREHHSVRQAAARYVKLAQQYVDSGKTVDNYAYPKSGQVYFYLLTYDGVRLCVGDEAAIVRDSDPTRPLFAAAQDVLTELRLMTDQENARSQDRGD